MVIVGGRVDCCRTGGIVGGNVGVGVDTWVGEKGILEEEVGDVEGEIIAAGGG